MPDPVSDPSSLFRRATPLVPLRGVHLDLKGLPPTPERLLSLLDLLAKARINLVLVEWEDAFPWTVDARFRSPTAYSPETVCRFCDRAAELGLELVPLVQSLGHMETPLRIPDYAPLRELPDDPAGLNPLAPGARDLVWRMVEDVLALMPGVRRFHLGGDEAWTLGQHPDTRAFVERSGKEALFRQHLEPLLERLNGRGIRPILWHDMLVHADDATLDALAPQCDLLTWGYSGHPDDARGHFNTAHLQRFREHGFALWGGTACKGADGHNVDLPEPARRSLNAQGWTDIARRFGYAGVIATAWSRYSTHRVQCEPIDAALDVLLLCAVILHDGEPPAGGLAACVEALGGFGERECFEACRSALQRLSGLRGQGWRLVQTLREQQTLDRMDPPRGSGTESARGLQRLEQTLQDAAAADAEVRRSFEGLVPACWMTEYLATRLQPLQDEFRLLSEAQSNAPGRPAVKA